VKSNCCNLLHCDSCCGDSGVEAGITTIGDTAEIPLYFRESGRVRDLQPVYAPMRSFDCDCGFVVASERVIVAQGARVTSFHGRDCFKQLGAFDVNVASCDDDGHDTIAFQGIQRMVYRLKEHLLQQSEDQTMR